MNVFCLNRATFKPDLKTFQISKQAFQSDVNLSQPHNAFKSRNGVKLTSKIMAVSLKTSCETLKNCFFFWPKKRSSAWASPKTKFVFFAEIALQDIFVPPVVLTMV